MKEKTAPVSGEDAEDKKRVKDIADAAATLRRTLGYYLKTLLDHAANTAALHEDLANLYPADRPLSLAVAQLHSSGAVFHDTPAMVEELRRLLEPPIDKILARTAALTAAAEERVLVRAEIEHYKCVRSPDLGVEVAGAECAAACGGGGGSALPAQRERLWHRVAAARRCCCAGAARRLASAVVEAHAHPPAQAPTPRRAACPPPQGQGDAARKRGARGHEEAGQGGEQPGEVRAAPQSAGALHDSVPTSRGGVPAPHTLGPRLSTPRPPLSRFASDRLHSNQKRFAELNAQISSGLAGLDDEVAAAVDAGIAGYTQASANFASGLLHCFGNAIAAVPGALRTGSAGPSAGVVLPSRAGGGSGGAAKAGAPATTAGGAARPAAATAPPGGEDDDGAAPTSASLSDFLGGGGAPVAAAAPQQAVSAGAAAATAAAAPVEEGEAAVAPAGAAGGSNPFD